MIIFVTKRDYSRILEGTGIKVEDSTNNLKEFLRNHKEIGYDKETNNLHPLKADALLSQFGDEYTQYVLDETSIPLTEVAEELSGCLLVGHNLKFDYKMSKVNGVVVRSVHDTMLSEQVIAKGSGLYFNLNAVVQRRLDILPLNKDEREGFWGKSPSSFFTMAQIKYAADDVKHLLPLKRIQDRIIKKYNLEKDLYDIEFPYLSLLGDAELEGFDLHEEGWRKIIAENEQKFIKYKNKLNDILRKLRIDYPKLKALRIDREAKLNKTYELNLFDDPKIVTAPVKNSINYASPNQVLRIWDLMNLPRPTIKKKDPKLGYKREYHSIGAESLEGYLNKNPTTPLKDFIDTLIKHNEMKTAIGTFGDRFLIELFRKEKGKPPSIGYKVNKTGKIYTIYRQCSAETTRLKSGDKDQGYYNSQNVPKELKYRNCFLADSGYLIITIDLSGAELVIAASLSGDSTLTSYLKEGDPHSPLCDYAYNNIIEYILQARKPYRRQIELEDLLEANYKLLGCTEAEAEKITQARVKEVLDTGRFNITKKTASDLRDNFKNVNYSMIYGGSIEKIMEILGIAKEFGAIVESSLRDKLPTLFSFLEASSKQGVEKGYIQFNQICGGRHWFKNILKYRKNGERPPFNIIGDVERACKNYPIQSTQGHMLKEASVRFYYDYVFPNGFDIRPKLWVHDEHVCMSIAEEAEHHAKVLQKYMNEVSSSYLTEGLKMESHYKVLPYWTK